jgi:hypothetical protein
LWRSECHSEVCRSLVLAIAFPVLDAIVSHIIAQANKERGYVSAFGGSWDSTKAPRSSFPT